MKLKILLAGTLCLFLMCVLTGCEDKKPIDQMTNSELIEEYLRLEYEIHHPKEITKTRSSGNPFDPDVEILESEEHYFHRMIEEQLKVEEELSRRNLSPEEQRQFDSIMAPKREFRYLNLPVFDSVPDTEGYSDSAVIEYQTGY